MTIGCNIWMICLKLNWFFYGESRMLQFSQFVWSLRSSVWDVFKNVHLIDATDRSKIISNQTRFFIALSLYPLSFFANTPFKWDINLTRRGWFVLIYFYNLLQQPKSRSDSSNYVYNPFNIINGIESLPQTLIF